MLWLQQLAEETINKTKSNAAVYCASTHLGPKKREDTRGTQKRREDEALAVATNGTDRATLAQDASQIQALQAQQASHAVLFVRFREPLASAVSAASEAFALR